MYFYLNAIKLSILSMKWNKNVFVICKIVCFSYSKI